MIKAINTKYSSLILPAKISILNNYSSRAGNIRSSPREIHLQKHPTLNTILAREKLIPITKIRFSPPNIIHKFLQVPTMCVIT